MNQIVVLNAGGQYCHLIARRIRELGVYAVVADIIPAPSRPSLAGVRGIILSGGPSSVYRGDVAQGRPRDLTTAGIPVLGICYGHAGSWR